MRAIRLICYTRLSFIGLIILASCASQAPSPTRSAGIAAESGAGTKTETSSPPLSPSLESAPKGLPQHVFLIVLENENYDVTFGEASKTHLKQLANEGVLLTHYYGIGHQSLDNYIAMISGQAPNEVTQSDCPIFKDFEPRVGNRDSRGDLLLDPDGQAVGDGCIYPPGVRTVADQLDKTNRFTWKAYMEDMGNASDNNTQRAVDERSRCRHPEIGHLDRTFDRATFHPLRPNRNDQYVTRHNPFVYFHSIIDRDEYCKEHDVPLGETIGNEEGLAQDLLKIETTPNFAFIIPNLCHDGHDPTPGEHTRNCRNGEKGGVPAVNGFLHEWVPKIRESPAFKKDGVLIITFDEAEDVQAPHPDSCATPDERTGPNTPTPGGEHARDACKGRGGGKVGAVVLSRFITKGSKNDNYYNHYSLLRSIEDLFGFDHDHLGFAGQPGLTTFQEGGVFNQPPS